MTILVTGAAGFVGTALCRRLQGKGHDVSRLSSQDQDIASPFQLPGSFDCAIHLAAHNITNVGEKDAAAYARVNVQGTENVLKAVRAKRFIFLSTVKVYKNEGRPLTEDSPVAPAGAYEQSKWEAEETCRKYFKGEGLVILRSANVLGWGQAPKAVVPVFFGKAMKNEALDIMVCGRSPLQFVAIDDIVDTFEAVLSHPQAQGIFNIAHREIATVEELAAKIVALTGSSSKINIRDRAEIAVAAVVCEKARKELGWSAKTGLDQILKDYHAQAVQALSIRN